MLKKCKQKTKNVIEFHIFIFYDEMDNIILIFFVRMVFYVIMLGM